MLSPGASRNVAALVLVTVLVSSVPAWAGGIWLYEMATPDQGTSAAGRAALASDASTAWTNPAGMTRLDRSQLSLGLGAIVIQSNFNVESGTTTSGGDGNLTSVLPVGSAAYVHSLTGDFKLGLALTPLPSLAGDYGENWAGRYYAQELALIGLAVSPVAAYRILPWLSVGAGPSIGFATMGQEAAINNVADRLPDGKLKVESSAVGIGGVVGVLFEPTPKTRIGVQYTTPMSFDFDNIIDSVNGVGPGLRFLTLAIGANLNVPVGAQVDMKLTMPQQVMVSAYHEFTDTFALMGNFGWQDWSAFGRPEVRITNTSAVTVDEGYQDTYHVAVGAHYRLTPSWLLMGGFAYDSSAVSDSKRTVTFAVDRQFRYSTGAQYALSKDITLGAYYTFIDAGPAPVNQSRGPLAGQIVGDYSPNFIHAVGLNLIWKF